MSKHHEKIFVRVTLLGDKKTGKTTFMKTYVGDEAKRNHEITESVGSAYSFDTVVDDTHIVLKILDSDGKHIAVTAWAHGVVILYSTDNYDSFLTAETCISEIREVTMRDAIIVLVANNNTGKDRVISTQDGEELSRRHHCSFIELSAVEDKTDVANVFYELSQQILIKRGLKKESRRPPKIFQRMMDAMGRRGSKQLPARLPAVTEHDSQTNAARETNI